MCRSAGASPQPHPYKAQYRHEYWFIDGRQMDFALDGVKWWSILILEGYSRTILAGAIAPTGHVGGVDGPLYGVPPDMAPRPASCR